jgi:outer membrane protein assembly factor BamD (BamD/ComL family)
MAPRRKRLTKQEIKHDPVIETALSVWHYYSRHSRYVNTIALAVVAVVVVAIAINSYSSSRAKESETELSRALLHLESQEIDRAVEMLEDLRSTRGGTSAGKRAVYFLAQAKFQQGNYAEAQDLFDRYVNHSVKDPLLKMAAKKGLADCMAEQGEYGEAGDRYLKIARQNKDNPLAPDCLYLAGLALWKNGQADRAAEALSTILESYEDYMRIGEVKVLIGEITASEKIIDQS